mmetsp:Transcript_35077/g.84666  ORF Transcript_35077/g.84666 Transcript_35077/m.84666 type:complete len:393 (-) Transcript_35077:831-2009(-)
MMLLPLNPLLFDSVFISAVLLALNCLHTTPATVAAFSPVLLPDLSHDREYSIGGDRMASSSALPSLWRPGTEFLDQEPSNLCKEGEDGEPQVAKDEAYASAVTKAWRDELDKRSSCNGGSVCSPLVYECKSDGDGSSLHGYIYRRSYIHQGSKDEKSLPGVVLFHTGAGPQDIFLRWKADSLVNEREVFGNKGCVVLIADILGDSSGWAWRDREKYANVRKSVLVPDEDGERKRLTGRIRSAIDALSSQPGVDPERIGAMGFCLGGHAILELARIKDPSVKAMATFHGVFDGVRKLSAIESNIGAENTVVDCNVLVCTGEDDPFVPSEDLDAAMKMFDDLGYRNSIMKFERTRHGFTNPAQDFNPSDAFAYSEDACTSAWSAALSRLKSTIC